MAAGRFVEVYINAPIEVCEKRDLKGLYAKARAHEVKDFADIIDFSVRPIRAIRVIRGQKSSNGFTFVSSPGIAMACS